MAGILDSSNVDLTSPKFFNVFSTAFEISLLGNKFSFDNFEASSKSCLLPVILSCSALTWALNIKCIEFHNRRRDFEKWARKSLRDNTLAKRLKKVRLSKMKGEKLRESLVEVTEETFEKQSKQIKATKYF